MRCPLKNSARELIHGEESKRFSGIFASSTATPKIRKPKEISVYEKQVQKRSAYYFIRSEKRKPHFKIRDKKAKQGAPHLLLISITNKKS
jgi:hypothetical protein